MDKTVLDALLTNIIEKPGQALLDNLKKFLQECGSPLPEDVSVQLEILWEAWGNESFDTAKGRTKEPSWTWNKAKRESLFDKTPQLWSIPLKDYAGKTILAVLEMNQRVNSKGDSALISMEIK